MSKVKERCCGNLKVSATVVIDNRMVISDDDKSVSFMSVLPFLTASLLSLLFCCIKVGEE